MARDELCDGAIMRKRLSHQIVLALAGIALCVLGLCILGAVNNSKAFLGKFLPENPYVTKPLVVVGCVLGSIGACLAFAVVIRSIVSLFTRTSWSRRSSLVALALIGCFTAWTTYRWGTVRHYGGSALFSTIEFNSPEGHFHRSRRRCHWRRRTYYYEDVLIKYNPTALTTGEIALPHS